MGKFRSILCLLAVVIIYFSCSAIAADFEENAFQDNTPYTLFDRSDAEGSPDVFPDESGIYSFIHITDTQYYTALAPEIFLEQCSFMALEKNKYNIQFIAHTGDIIDCSSLSSQWLNAKNGLNILENAELPRQIVAGNHDVGGEIDYTNFLAWCGADTYINNYTDMYAYDNGKAIVQIVTVNNGHRWMFVGIGWCPGADELEWAASIMSMFPECPAVIMTHDYLDVNGTISTNGQKLRNYLIDPFPNVRLILCGHNHSYATNVACYDDNSDGVIDRRVYAMLADYQADDDKLTGKFRMLTVSEPDSLIYVRTYSTKTCSFVDDDAFVIQMEDDWFSLQNNLLF